MYDELFATKQLNERTMWCISMLSNTTFNESGGERFNSNSGYFFYELTNTGRTQGISILANIPDTETAYKMVTDLEFQLEEF